MNKIFNDCNIIFFKKYFNLYFLEDIDLTLILEYISKINNIFIEIEEINFY